MNILEVKNVSKLYARHRALNNVSLDVPSGCVYGLLGPNGAGKTSLIRIITQITAADEGQVLFNGQPLSSEHIYQIGYLPEERGLYKKMEVGEQLLYFARLKGLSRSEAMHVLKDWVEKFEITGWWKKKVEELSKGMQQKIQFIATVLHRPKLIILDEPFSGFDPINANIITEEILRLKEQGSSIIFSTHRMESVEQLCDYIALINKSEKVLEGPVKKVREQFRTFEYKLEYEGEPLTSNAYFSVSGQKSDMGQHSCILKPTEGQTSNHLLAKVMEQVEVKGFTEQLPDMNEIFIRVVSGNHLATSIS